MKKIFGLILAMLSLIFVVSCKSEKGEYRFVDYSISTKGVLTWNKIEKAKYYYVNISVSTNFTTHAAEKWVESNKIDLSSQIIELGGDMKVSIEAYSSKMESGRLLYTEKLQLCILKQSGNFYLEKDAKKYTVKFDTGGLIDIPDLTDYILSLPEDIDETRKTTWYYDKEYTKEAFKQTFITGDITLYAKFELKTCKVTVYGDTTGNTILKDITVDINTVIEETDMPDYIPKNGYTFVYWEVRESSSSFYEIEFPFKVTTYISLYPVYKRN